MFIRTLVHVRCIKKDLLTNLRKVDTIIYIIMNQGFFSKICRNLMLSIVILIFLYEYGLSHIRCASKISPKNQVQTIISRFIQKENFSLDTYYWTYFQNSYLCVSYSIHTRMKHFIYWNVFICSFYHQKIIQFVQITIKCFLRNLFLHSFLFIVLQKFLFLVCRKHFVFSHLLFTPFYVVAVFLSSFSTLKNTLIRIKQ